MANPRSMRTHPGPTEHPELDRCSHVEVSLPTAPQTGADEVYGPTLSVAVELYEVRKPYNQWLYGYFIELHHIGPVDVGPLPPEPHRCNSIDCVECWNAGGRYSDYLKAKRIRDANGF